ncbi:MULTISPECIES: helix-turn-helix domain-containing protein [unclassified Streptococcus]|uniref:helix-turn-helix transcriptional regulator n=1 Tax=unclassified Streptococcus TaxID=2608887 RepID=UPI00211AEBF7|nr:helix-turn-helix domain-containing protein [Streptococcus sp. B01]MCQ9212878.1 helix-turn-helix domain-containing protein [Streptococcus sp. B01]MCQ9212969.1 helix-turn-helix domain-containing protein [Streptococcus sp. O1]MCQ9214994.1 helix-turn-helix domain-containing protein [Streptococcus sp. O1]
MQIHLIQARKEAGITQEELAQKIGISTTSYYKKETGKRDFKLKECYRIAEILNKEISDLFTR